MRVRKCYKSGMSNRRFVIPDIHGCARSFLRLIQDVIRLRPADRMYILGDMIDRGPRSKEVIDTILRLKSAGFAVYPVRGNHEEMLLNACNDLSDFRLWMLNGGHATLASFNVEDPAELPRHYREFFQRLPYYIELNDFILLHGNLNFRIQDPLSDTEAMIWLRSNEVQKKRIGGKRVIGGHTPLPREEIEESLAADKIMLDNGCVYTGEHGMGSLAALELNSMTLYFQENIDM
jgi:serine/threonine protein phosphatase 1